MTASMTNLKNMSMLLALATTLLIVTPASSILSPLRLAQAAPQGRLIKGSGEGQLNCPPSGSSPPGNETIHFSAYKGKQFLPLLTWYIQGGDSQFKIGNITGGHVTGNQFTLTGTESTDNLCSSQVPATITITGQCGQGVLIQFKSSNGEEGEFAGSVVCHS
jgi:hypothetical protein